MEDVTKRLRMSSDPDEVSRERELARSLFCISIGNSGSALSSERMQQKARSSISAACIFWEEWDIAVLTPDVTEASEPAALRGRVDE